MSPTAIPGNLILQSPTANDPLLDLNTQPSLDLQFATSKTLDDAVSGTNLITFSRASSGTYVDSDGLIKTSPVNLLTYSDYSQVDATTDAQLEGVVAAPDGTITARRYSAPSAGLDTINKSSTLGTAGKDYTFSVWVRSTGTASEVGLNVGDAGFVGVVQISTQWQRFEITKINNASFFIRGYVIILNVGDEVEVFGAQIEEGSTATDYIPTGATISGAPRFDHDPVTGESLGLLIEESRTNYIDNSNDLSQWNRPLFSPVFDANTTDTLSPDGTYNSTKITGGTNSGVSRDNILAASASTPYTASFFAKKGTADNVTVELGSGGNRVATNFNISTKTFSLSSATGYFASSSLSYVDYPNGWVRVIVSGTTDGSASGNINLAIYGVTNGYAYFWGAQVEANASFPTSYIPTSGSTVTRAADLASIEGTNFSSWYNQSEGTVFVAVDKAYKTNTIAAAFDDGSGANRIEVRSSGSSLSNARYVITDNSTTVYSKESSTAGANRLKLALAYKTGSVNNATNGVIDIVDATASIPNVSRLAFQNEFFLTDQRPGHIARLAYYPYRLADATLQEITS